MVFSSLIFIFAFLPIVALLYFLPFGLKTKNIILLVASLLFYAYGEPSFVLVMMASIFLNYLFGLGIKKYKQHDKLFLVMACLFNLGLLFVFKYLGFISRIFASVWNTTIIQIALPIGISFFTFQALSYVIDVYRGTTEAQSSIIDLGLYIAFFPQLIAGPIVRYNTIAEAIDSREHSVDIAADGMCRFLRGLAKKVLIANTLAVIADFAFEHTEQISMAMAWLGLISYAMQIYYDFSGYSDMAIGLAKIFGFNLEENFNYPYISKSVSDFWRRWHISLGRWFRDYLYFPLGGSRVESKWRLLFNLFVVWTLTGIWHGANFTFALWGLYYFFFIAIEKLLNIEKRLSGVGTAVYRLFTIIVVLFGWLIFRADSLVQVQIYLRQMFNFTNVIGFREGTFIQSFWYALLAGILFSVPIAPYIKSKFSSGTIAKVMDIVKPVVYIVLFIITISALVIGTHNPFIYFQF